MVAAAGTDATRGLYNMLSLFEMSGNSMIKHGGQMPENDCFDMRGGCYYSSVLL